MTEDHAIIIGIQNYPGLDSNGAPSLAGVESDANEFEQWLLDPNGGDVPKDRIDKVLSSKFPPAREPADCKPAFEEVKRVFDVLRRRSIQKDNANLGPKLGRRLYIYMSGHGISPTPYGQISKEVGLLMANVDPVNILDNQSHLPGCFMAEWFCLNGCFEEVFLFMDCCRDVQKTAQPNIVFMSQGTNKTARRFYAFACQWGRRAKERNIDGKMQGVFTKTLLLALKGAAAEFDPQDQSTGTITAASLKAFLINNTREFLDQAALNAGDLDEPDIEIIPNGNNERAMVIKQVPLQKFPAILYLSNPMDAQATIMTGQSKKLLDLPITGQTTRLDLLLPRGIYFLEGISGGKIVRTEGFEVKGIEKPGREAVHHLTFT